MVSFDLYHLAVLCLVLCTDLPEGAPCLWNPSLGVLNQTHYVSCSLRRYWFGTKYTVRKMWINDFLKKVKGSELKRWLSG